MSFDFSKQPVVLAKPVMVCGSCGEKYIVYKMRFPPGSEVVLRTIHGCGVSREHKEMLGVEE